MIDFRSTATEGMSAGERHESGATRRVRTRARSDFRLLLRRLPVVWDLMLATWFLGPETFRGGDTGVSPADGRGRGGAASTVTSDRPRAAWGVSARG